MKQGYQKIKKITIVQGGDGDRDISYNDSFDISEQLAGTLGPVQTQDSLDVNDTFVADQLVLQDSIEAADALTPIEGLVAQDSFDVSERLAGTLGPVQTQDSIVASDDPVFGPLVLRDSFDFSALAELALTAKAQDSFDIHARLGQITRFDDEAFFAGDALGPLDAVAGDSFAVADAFDGDRVQVRDSFGVIVSSEATLTAANEESFAVADFLMGDALDAADSLAIADARGNANVTNARLWPNTVVSNTGFTNPANMTDLSEGTAATISATQSGGLVGGSSQTVNGNIQVSCPDVVFSPDASTSSVQLQVGYTTTASGGLQSGNSVNVAIEYSLNDGATWTNITTVTNTATTQNPTVNITATTAQLNQLRFRAVGSVVSGTTLLVGGANQQFQFRYARVQFNAVQVL